MRIAVLGATGMAGSAVVDEALSRGHAVSALSRNPRAMPSHPRHTTRAVDVGDTVALDPVFADADAAVLAIRLAPGEEHRCAPLTHGVLDVAARHGTRVLVIGGSAPLRSPGHPDRLVIDDPDHVPPAWQAVARASLAQFEVCTEHPHREWAYLSPPAVLEPGERSAHYRRGTDSLLTDDDGRSWITAPDLAIAVLDELEHRR